MNTIKTALTLIPLCLTSITFSAQASTWSGEAELGAVVTSGNTETQTVNAKGKLVNEREKWKHTGFVWALNAADDVRTTAERYGVIAKSDYKISEFDYVFINISYEDDRFSGYEYQATESLGYGRRVIHQPNVSLDLEGGPGARQGEIKDGDSENEAILRLAGDLVWKISDSAEFGQALLMEIGEDITITRSTTALKAQIVGSLAMKVSFMAKNTSDVPVGTEKTDTETALTLVYNF